MVRQPNPKNPVFEVRPEDGLGAKQTVHRNMLRHCAFIARRSDVPLVERLATDPLKPMDGGFCFLREQHPLKLESPQPQNLEYLAVLTPSPSVTPDRDPPRHSQRTNFGRLPAYYNDYHSKSSLGD